MRRRPTLPHTFAYSTIGPAGLNFRVRDGNGWNPRGKITARLAVQLALAAQAIQPKLELELRLTALNLSLRGASQVLHRVAAQRVFHEGKTKIFSKSISNQHLAKP